MNDEFLVERLREYAEWAEANKEEVPVCLPQHLIEAADRLEKLMRPTGIDELGLSTRAYESLYRRGYRYLREISKLGERELLKIPGIGSGAAKEIMEKVKEAMNG